MMTPPEVNKNSPTSFFIKELLDRQSALTIEEKLGQFEVVKFARVDLKKGLVEIQYNSEKGSFFRISDAIKELGFNFLPQKKIFSIQGMSCVACVSRVEKRLKRLDGILAARVNLASEKVEIETVLTPKLGVFKNALEPIGFGIAELNQLSNSSQDVDKGEATRTLTHKLICASILAIFMMIGKYLQVLTPLSMFFLAAPVQFWAGSQFYLGAWKVLRHGSADMNSLVALGSNSAFGLSVWTTFFSSSTLQTSEFSGIYFDSSVMIVTLVLLGRFLESKAKSKASGAVKKLLNLRPQKAKVLKDGVEKTVVLEKLQKGDIVCVRPGEKFPADGKVVEGSGYVDESMITGESLGVDKNIGDRVIGGSYNQNGFLKYKADQLRENSVLGHIVKMVEEAQGSKAPIQRIADIVASVFTPLILIIAGLTFGVWATWGNEIAILSMPEQQFAWMAFVSVLVVACPCALGLATPAAIIVGTGKSAEHGVFFKGGEVLENAEKIEVVVFDKTGTLTLGIPEVTEVWALPSIGEKSYEVLAIASGIEEGSNHPLAIAIKKEADNKKIKVKSCIGFASLTGYGVQGMISNETILLGNARLMEDNGVDISEVKERATQWANEGKTSVFLSRNSQLIGILAISDSLKPEAKRLTQKLREMGFRLAIITGDNIKTAEYIANKLGISDVYAEQLPGQKAETIQQLQAGGFKVAMIGDGVNDAPALAQADIGIALGTGTDIAKETSDITLISGDLKGIVNTFELSKKTMQTIRQNLFWAFFYNLMAVPIAAGMLFPLWGIVLKPVYAAAAMSLSSVSVIGNSLLLNRYRPN
jgi:Cu+-exporting ATPase